MPDGKEFSHEIWDMTVVNCETEKGEKMQFAVSKKLIKKTELKNNDDKTEAHVYFYLRDTHPIENPMNGVYIIRADFPKELRKPKPKDG